MPLERLPAVIGDIDLSSRLMSNRWQLSAGGAVVAELLRVPTRHTSLVELASGERYDLVPEAWGTVVARSGNDEVGRAERTSWLGRSWSLTGPAFSVALTSDPLPRRWSLRLGSEPVARISGGVVTYNRLRIHSDVTLPIVAIALAWHVLARPWEAAAAPRVMVPQPPHWRQIDE